MDFMDFGGKQDNCYLIKEGFLLWKINGDRIEKRFRLEGNGSNMIIHILVRKGEIKLNSDGKPYLLTEDCLANFLDSRFLDILEISCDAQAYMLMSSLLKKTPPFPPSYVQKIKMCPMSFQSPTGIKLFLQRIEAIQGIFADHTHRFQAEMVKCALWMFMMDMANEYIRQEDESKEHTEKGRRNTLFKQFIKLLFTDVREGHSVSWYASKLCVTPQYLNRVVKDCSQKTAYDPKFFKRQTGKTPTEYRRMFTDRE